MCNMTDFMGFYALSFMDNNNRTKKYCKNFLKTNLIFKENLIIDIIRYEQKGKRSEKYVSKNTKKEF